MERVPTVPPDPPDPRYEGWAHRGFACWDLAPLWTDTPENQEYWRKFPLIASRHKEHRPMED